MQSKTHKIENDTVYLKDGTEAGEDFSEPLAILTGTESALCVDVQDPRLVDALLYGVLQPGPLNMVYRGFTNICKRVANGRAILWHDTKGTYLCRTDTRRRRFGTAPAR